MNKKKELQELRAKVFKGKSKSIESVREVITKAKLVFKGGKKV